MLQTQTSSKVPLKIKIEKLGGSNYHLQTNLKVCTLVTKLTIPKKRRMAHQVSSKRCRVLDGQVTPDQHCLDTDFSLLCGPKSPREHSQKNHKARRRAIVHSSGLSGCSSSMSGMRPVLRQDRIAISRTNEFSRHEALRHRTG